MCHNTHGNHFGPAIFQLFFFFLPTLIPWQILTPYLAQWGYDLNKLEPTQHGDASMSFNMTFKCGLAVLDKIL